MTALRRFLLGLLGLVVLLCAAAWWLLSTESGTRFIVARASGFLPSALTIEEISGTVRTQILASGIRWQDAATDARVERLNVGINLWRLLEEEVSLDQLQVDGVRVSVVTAEPPAETAEPAEPLDIQLPIGIELLTGVIRDIQLNINGFERRIDQLEISAAIQGADLRVRDLTLSSDWLNLVADGRVRLSDTLPATATIDWQYFDVPDWPLTGRLELGGDLDSFAIEHALSRPVVVQSTGEIAVRDEGLFVDLENRWEELRVEAFDLSSRRGMLRLTGSPSAFDADLSAVGTIANGPETTINAEARMTPSSAQSVFVDARNSWGTSDVRGEASWGESLQFDFEFDLDDIDVQAWAPQLSGSLAMQGRVNGNITEQKRIAELEIVTLNGVLNTFPVTGSGTLLVDDTLFSIPVLVATVGTNRITANGSIGETVNLAGSVNADTLAAFHPDLQGTAEASATLRGRIDNPKLDLSVATTGLAWQNNAIEQLDILASGTARQHVIEINSKAFSTDLALELNGGLLDAGWSGEIKRFGIAHPRAGLWSLESPAMLAVQDSSILLRDFCLLGNEGELCATLRTANTVTTFDLDIQRLPLSLLPVRLPASVQADGDIYAKAVGELNGKTLNASAELDVRDTKVTSTFEDETLVTPFSIIRLDAQVTDNRLTGSSRVEAQEGRLEIEASVANIFDSASALDGSAELDIPELAQLSGLLPALANPVGVAGGELLIAGSIVQPEITGSIQLRDGAFGIRAAGVRVENIAASISQDTPGALALQASATSGDGNIELLGETTISDGNKLSTRFTLTGSRFELAKTPDVKALASPNVTVLVTETETTVSGELGIPKASVTLKEIPPSAARVSPDAVIHQSGDATEVTQQRPIIIDLKAVLGDEVELAAFGLATQLQGNLQLRGDANKTISGFGRVSLVKGRYKAYGQELAIQRGELIFNGPLNRPQLDVRAIRNAGDVVAGIQVRGTPDALLSDVFSQPGMRDIEALSYLLTGRPLNQENRDGDLLGDAAFALGLSGAGAITSRVRSNLGLDTLSIQGGTEDGRIVAGKRLNDRLLVEYGYGIVDRLGTLLLRYQLNDRLVLESRTGVVSNLDVVYRVRKP